MKNNQTLNVFDLDRTLLKKNSSFTYYFFLREKKILPKNSIFLSLYYYMRYLICPLSPEELHKKIFLRFLKGQNKEKIFSHAFNFFSSHIKELVYQPAINALKLAQKREEKILLISNSPEEIVKVIAKILKIKEFAATKYSVDENHNLEEIVLLMGGEGKANFVQNYLRKNSFSKIVVYSDSYFDMPLFSLSTHPVAVNPDNKLKKWAQKHHWEIL